VAKSKKFRPPKYRRHKGKYLAAVTIDGKHIYLGKWDSPESHRRYEEEIRKLLLRRQAESHVAKNGASPHASLPPSLPTPVGQPLSLNELAERYLAHCETYYVKNGRPTSELACITAALKPAIEGHGLNDAGAFGPVQLRAVRERMIERDLARTTINQSVDRIRRMFKWGAGHGLVNASVWQGLQAVEGLREGRSAAKESPGVRPVDPAHVEAIYDCVPPQVEAMLRLQLITGMRPAEVTLMRPCDIDRTSELWEYKPEHHKNSHRGHSRVVYLGKRAQKILGPFLERAEQSYLFSPHEADQWRRTQKRAKRKSKVTPSQAKRVAKANGRRRPGARYDTASFRRAVKYGTKAANATRNADSQIPEWSPLQIRHTTATAIRAEHGLEAAQVILGHKNCDVTQVYAETSQKLAKNVARKKG
jgi:integrase